LRIVHPFPTLLNVAATAGLAFAAADGAPPAGELSRMLAAMLLAQSAIGVTNDVFDRDLDAATKPLRPIPSGLVSLRVAVALAVAFVVSALALAATLGTDSLGLLALGTSCGLVYDARLKRTAASALPFMVAIPTLPAWVYVTLGAWEPVLWWLLPLGALIGLSVHLANTAPDIGADAEHDVRGLAHRLGVAGSVVLSWSAFGLALLLALALGPVVHATPIWYASALGVGAACLSGAIVAYRLRGAEALGFNFGVMGVASAAAAGGWLAAVT
jgi:4-hydroxybenzoate polyprenyltransferase